MRRFIGRSLACLLLAAMLVGTVPAWAVSTGFTDVPADSWCAANEGLDGRAAAAFVDCVQEQLGEMLCARRDCLGLSHRELRRLCALMDRCAAYLRVNVGPKHIFGLLAVDSIAGSGNRG